MALRRGVGGATLENVANVARFGSQAMPARNQSATSQLENRFAAFTRPLTVTNPEAASRIMSIEPGSLDQTLFGTRLSTAGKKYAGFPTAASMEQAIAGRAYQILEEANLAAKLAAENQARLQEEYNAFEEADALRAAEDQARYEAEIARAEANVPSAWDILTKPGESLASRQAALQDLGRARATQQFTVGQPERRLERQAERVLGQMAVDVDPYQQVAEEIQSYSPAELARQIATQQYGMTPESAYGMFTDDFTTQYYNDQIALEQAKRDYEAAQQGFYGETLEETIFRTQGATGLEEYRLNRAAEAMGTDPASQAKAAEDELSGRNAEIDQQLAQDYLGLAPGDVVGNVDPTVTRKAMQDPTFRTAFTDAVAAFSPNGAQYDSLDTVEQRRAKINEYAVDKFGNTVYAEVLANIIASFALFGA